MAMILKNISQCKANEIRTFFLYKSTLVIKTVRLVFIRHDSIRSRETEPGPALYDRSHVNGILSPSGVSSLEAIKNSARASRYAEMTDTAE